MSNNINIEIAKLSKLSNFDMLVGGVQSQGDQRDFIDDRPGKQT